MAHNLDESEAGRPLPLSERRYTVEVYHNDIKVKQEGALGPMLGGGERGQVREFSKASCRRLAFVASNTTVVFDVMITLTWPDDYPRDGNEWKRCLRKFLDVWTKSPKRSYLWWLEFQKRGAPHFHILTCGLDLLSMRGEVSSHWYEVVDSGDEKHLLAGTRVEKVRDVNGAKHYAVWYSKKLEQKRVPDDVENVGRFWGHSRDVKPVKLGEGVNVSGDELKKLLSSWEYNYVLRDEEHCPAVLFNATEHLDRE